MRTLVDVSCDHLILSHLSHSSRSGRHYAYTVIEHRALFNLQYYYHNSGITSNTSLHHTGRSRTHVSITLTDARHLQRAKPTVALSPPSAGPSYQPVAA